MGLVPRCLIAALMLACSSLAHAAWHKASSEHFIIYSDDRPERLKAFAEKLERFDQAARRFLRQADPAVGDGNRLSIFVLDNVAQVRRLHGEKDNFIYGFYFGRYTGSVAFTPRRADDNESGGLNAEAVFFHEYAHHLLFQNFNRPYPNWYIEGFAELLATPKFDKDGSIALGVTPQHRAYGLVYEDGLTTSQLLIAQPVKMTQAQRESIYGRGWLLTHFLRFDAPRAGQMDKFLANLTNGQPTSVAATNAFGDLKQLDRDLNAYLKRRRILAMVIPPENIKIEPVEVVPLSVGAGEAMASRMLSKRGVNAAEGKAVVANLRQIGQRNANDAFVQQALAEAEYDVGNHAASLSAAEAALRINPRSVEALVYKGRALVELAAKADGSPNFAKARQAYLAANKIDTEDPEPLFLFFESYVREGERPTANAISALHYASALAPQDVGLRINSALAWLYDKKLAEARLDLLPIAFDPHGGEATEAARAAVDRISAKDSQGAISALSRKRSDEDADQRPIQ